MKNVQLITTSIEEKIKDCEIVYLGNWCKNNDYIISEGKVCKYHWDDRIKLENDNNYLVKFYENILLELSNKLNKIHNTKYSIEYWRINLGYWLFCYLCSIFDRWENVKICLNQYGDINFFKKYDFGLLPAPKTTREFMNLATDTKWNHLIYSKIIEFLNKKEKTNIKIIYEILKNEDFYYNYKPDVQHKIKSYLINLYSQIFGMFIKKNKIILYKTYFGKLNEFILNLKYKQLPFVLSEGKFNNKINFELRNKLELDINPNNLFEKFVLANLFINIPTEFLEDFNDIEKYIKRSKLPNNPKLIFTTRTLSKDNLFIRYCAIKKETGTKLVYGQHGGVYGQIKFCWVEDNEIKISDYYLTWGWESKNENKLLPFGILKKIDNFKFKKINELKKISYFMRSRPKYTNKIDSSTGTNQMSKYFKNCLNFFDQTELNLKKKIKIYPRFHEAEFGWNHYNIWKKKKPYLDLIFSNEESLKFVYMKYDLLIYSYIGTGFLESLALDKPFILISSLDEWPLRDEVYQDFVELKKAKIFFEKNEEAITHLNDISLNCRTLWWETKYVINIKDNFKKKYAKLIKKKEKIKSIDKIINRII